MVSLSDIAFSDAKQRLVAESNLEKKIQSLTQKYRTHSKLQNEIKKFTGFKVFKNVSF